FHLWSDKFDRDLEDIFEVQDEISHKIAEKLRVELLEIGGDQLVKRPTDNLEAYTLYLKGRHLWSRRIESDLLRSVGYFEQATELDSNFALGYAGLADARMVLADHDYRNRKEHLRLAEEAANKALELDDSLAEPHAALASALYHQWKWIEAEREFKKAIELNSSYPTAHQWYGLYLIIMRRLQEAGEQLALARELDPLSPAMIMAHSVYCYIAREYDKAIETCRDGTELSGHWAFLMITGWSLVEKGDYVSAIEQLNRSRELSSRQLREEKPPPDIVVFLGRAYALAGEAEKARSILKDCLQIASDGKFPSTGIAALYISLRDDISALEWLERASRDLEDWLPTFSLTPLFDSVRNNPRFISLLSRVGLSNKPEGGWRG
ncbi:MAG: hypothetical protein ACK2T3_12820, partial [Candidatus Promineifilaceae bacterium]